ncbi:MAG: aconitase X catalytic domain-containing protein [Candidatus Lokiarchaeota archaeon]|nr:aconitase X catalytic domain-containing protein [Candidatus Lokiarchaeota archaeon]
MSRMLAGESGAGTQVAAEMIAALAKIYGAEGYVPIVSAQIAGVSYKNIGEAGIEFLESMRKGGARTRARATLNPCGLDLEAWRELGFQEQFYKDQARALDAYRGLGIEMTCSCTPYLIGNAPGLGDHVAWSESSALSYANSVLGARTNREGGPSALAAAITGYTGNYGLHLDENRVPSVHVHVTCPVETYQDFGSLGLMLGKKLGQSVSIITGLQPGRCTPERLRQLGASMAASGAVALYHVAGATPEAGAYTGKVASGEIPTRLVEVASIDDVSDVVPAGLAEGQPMAVDLVFVGCPHASKGEALDLLGALEGRELKADVWIAMARDVKRELIQDAAFAKAMSPRVKLVADTCIVVCPIDDLGYSSVATNSGKAYFYLKNNPRLAVAHRDTAACLDAAVTGIAINKDRGEA